MDQVRIKSVDNDARYPVQPIPLDAYTQFKDFLIDYIQQKKLINTPQQQGLDY